MLLEYEGVQISWLGHASFLIEDSKTICIDPYKLDLTRKVDVVISTHEHGDHCDKESLKKIVGNDTILVGSKGCESTFKDLGAKEIKILSPGDSLDLDNVKIETISAHNVNKFRSPGVVFHRKEDKHIGVIITINGKKIYHTGDSDFIPEMEGLQVDVALLPVSGTYVMTAQEAIEAASKIKPKLAIPMHYGRGVVGSEEDAQEFKQGASCRVEILTFEG